MTESETISNRLSTIPFLPPDIVELIVSHCIEPYSLRIAYCFLDFKRRVQIYNITRVEPLQLISHAFNNAVKRQIRQLFTGRVVIDCDSVLRIRRHRRNRSRLVEWLFDHTSSLVITDYYEHFSCRKAPLNLHCWPAIRWLVLCTTYWYFGRCNLKCDSLERFDDLVPLQHPEYAIRLERTEITTKGFSEITKALASLRSRLRYKKSSMLRIILQLKHYPIIAFAEQTDGATFP